MRSEAHSRRLTVGSAVGSIAALFSKIKAIDAKHGKFDFVLCTGDFFGPPGDEGGDTEKLLSGELEGMLRHLRSIFFVLKTPDSTIGMLYHPGKVHFAGDCCREVCKNRRRDMQKCMAHECVVVSNSVTSKLTRKLLKDKSGVLTTAHGLRIACLGGIYDEELFHSAEAAPVSST